MEQKYKQDWIEYWLARDLQELLDYTQWRNFLNVIEKAKIACKNSGNEVFDHFADIPAPQDMHKSRAQLVRNCIPHLLASDLLSDTTCPL